MFWRIDGNISSYRHIFFESSRLSSSLHTLVCNAATTRQRVCFWEQIRSTSGSVADGIIALRTDLSPIFADQSPKATAADDRDPIDPFIRGGNIGRSYQDEMCTQELFRHIAQSLCAG